MQTRLTHSLGSTDRLAHHCWYLTLLLVDGYRSSQHEEFPSPAWKTPLPMQRNPTCESDSPKHTTNQKTSTMPPSHTNTPTKETLSTHHCSTLTTYTVDHDHREGVHEKNMQDTGFEMHTYSDTNFEAERSAWLKEHYTCEKKLLMDVSMRSPQKRPVSNFSAICFQFARSKPEHKRKRVG